jgi:hypothetical protein
LKTKSIKTSITHICWKLERYRALGKQQNAASPTYSAAPYARAQLKQHFPHEYGHDAPTSVNFSNNQHKK